MTLFLTVLHVLVCLVLIVVVLLQRGKGAEVGAVFGGGGGSTMFGARGAGNFLTRLASAAAVIFMFTSLTLAYFARDDTGSALFEGVEAPAEEGGFETVPTPEPAAEAGGFEEVGGGFEEVAPAETAPTEAPEPSAEAEPAPSDPAPAP